METALYDNIILALSAFNLCFSIVTAILFFYLFFHLFETRFKWLFFLTGLDCFLLCVAYLNFVITGSMSHIVLIAAISLLLTVLFINGIMLYVYSKSAEEAVEIDCERIMTAVKENIYVATGNSS